jgi:hypothetical protein
MNWPLFIPLLATASIAVIGWFAAHWFAASRDRTNKRRDMRLSRLIDAYNALERSAHRPFIGDRADAVSDAMADVQLLGSPAQVELAQKLVMELASRQGVDWQPLLLSIRDEIRVELRLAKLPAILRHLRVDAPPAVKMRT